MINGLTFDGATTNPMEMAVRDALIGFMAATAQAQAEATKGREQLAMVQDMLGQSANIIAIAKATNLSRQTVYRIKGDPASAEAALATWEA